MEVQKKKLKLFNDFKKKLNDTRSKKAFKNQPVDDKDPLLAQS